MAEMERPKDTGVDRRTIFMILIAFILGALALFAIDNRDSFFASRTPDDAWDRINSRIVEQNCLDQAKKVAVSEGYSDAFVLSCSCLYVESRIMKTFDCDVNTIDVTHPARKVLVHCYRSSSQCTIASDKGLQTYNLSDIAQYIVK
ncbi:MAG: hypothetical protein U0R44_01200 [Candidatus Micrarchaeia archaeon]